MSCCCPAIVPSTSSRSRVPGRNVGKQLWSIDYDELRRAITPRTKMIVLNSPHSPLGKVFSHAELESIARLAVLFFMLGVVTIAPDSAASHKRYSKNRMFSN
ncbi:hypothetical protein PYCCODRAFT_1122374 [Trametes coccinea BRFM310]|uniref:Aminotransferase class I/classII large domain-containing protein n=1 Tax=Trametes coccinea (strain BRFM310) TaxID=1353009 RepID=A0A1Y2I8V7_TRAC3|nr:hypothetical protein PYCCODRAFT_1122374 [Trametes coccinea BRFM310]